MNAPQCFPFIVGRGRSGTTLLRAMFDSHAKMAIPQESHFVVNMGMERGRYEHGDGLDVDLFLSDLFEHFGFVRWRLPAEVVTAAFRDSPPASFPAAIRGVFASYARYHGKSRYGDKTPGYVMSMRLLADLFPESRFVHVIRDGRDVALSYLEGGWGPRTLAGNAVYWRRFVRRGRKEGARLGADRYCEVRYESLLDDPERELRRLSGFVGLEFDVAMLQYFERSHALLVTPRLVQTHGALRLPPTKGLRDWRREMSNDQLTLFEALAGDLLNELGYERAIAHIPARARLAAQREWASVQTHRVANRLGGLRRRAFRSSPG
jgi:hypothetical protein